MKNHIKMKNSLLIVNLIVVLFVAKLKAESYESFQGSNQPVQEQIQYQNGKSFYKSLTNNKLKKETMIRMQSQAPEVLRETRKEPLKTKGGQGDDTLPRKSTIKATVKDIDNLEFGGKLSSSKVDVKDRDKSAQEKSQIYKSTVNAVSKNTGKTLPRSEHIGYNRELINALGYQFEDVEVLSNQNNNDQEHFLTHKSKLYAVHPYQLPKRDMYPSMHGPHGSILYLDNEDVSSLSRYILPYIRNLQLQYSYLPQNKNSLFKLFPGLASKSPELHSSNKPMTINKNDQHSKLSLGSTSKITLEREKMAWPFGYDLTQNPVEYSLLHKIGVHHYPHVVETGMYLEG